MPLAHRHEPEGSPRCVAADGVAHPGRSRDRDRQVWAQSSDGIPASKAAQTDLGEVITLDIDATIVVAHSEKGNAAASRLRARPRASPDSGSATVHHVGSDDGSCPALDATVQDVRLRARAALAGGIRCDLTQQLHNWTVTGDRSL